MALASIASVLPLHLLHHLLYHVDEFCCKCLSRILYCDDFKRLTYVFLIFIWCFYVAIITYPINQSTVSRRYSGSLSSLPPPPPPPPPFPPSAFFCEVVVVLIVWSSSRNILSLSFIMSSICCDGFMTCDSAPGEADRRNWLNVTFSLWPADLRFLVSFAVS